MRTLAPNGSAGAAQPSAALVAAPNSVAPEAEDIASNSAVLAVAMARWAVQFGTASRVALLRALDVMADRDRGNGEATALVFRVNEVERVHCARYGKAALAAELADEREREAAVTDDLELLRYQHKWERKLACLQRAQPQHWAVGGLSPEETRDALTLRLLELLRSDLGAREHYDRAGKAWGLSVAERHLVHLRKAFRLSAVPTDFREPVAVLDRGPGFEERLLEREAEAGLELARETAERSLSCSQRRWLSAMKLAARGGQFFASSAELNLSAASRLLGRNRSSAARAFKELQERFQRERVRFDS
jgi:hypothetical protein